MPTISAIAEWLLTAFGVGYAFAWLIEHGFGWWYRFEIKRNG